ncbi:variable large family protein, partial [Pseudomonas aeruginosa]|nr:variable large family protein [Pseudomonas aeruginosa]
IMTFFLLFSCGGQLQAAKFAAEYKNNFLDSLVKIGQGLQELFGIFGNAIGDALGLTAVKSGDKRNKVGEHFKKIGNGLTETNNKLKELAGQMSEAKNADESTIKVVEDAIKGANEVFEKLVDAITKLAGVTNDSATDIGDTASAGAAVAADKNSVDTVIAEVKKILDAAEKSGVKVEKGNAGSPVAASNSTDATAVLAANAAAGANAGPKLADEVSKADPWAMIDKIKDSKTTAGNLSQNNHYDAGTLAVGTPNHANGAGAATNADLAAAVALKAMTTSGKLSATANEVVGVKAAGVSAVNKVLGVFDLIIRKTVARNLDKIREAVKEIQYSETTGTNTQDIQSTATK